MLSVHVTELQTRAVEFVDFDGREVEVFETVEVNHGHVVTCVALAVAVWLDSAGGAKDVVDVVLIKVVGRLCVRSAQEGKGRVGDKSE